MSVSQRLLAGEKVDVDDLATAVVTVLFGNYLGATLFVASLAWIGLYWRLGFFSNDQYTFANTLLGVVDGHLYVDRAVYGPPSGATPGTHLVDGRVYGRNYGIVVVAAVWYIFLKLLSLIADIRVVVVGLWSLTVVATAVGVGTLLGRRQTALWTGTALGAVLFVANLAVATPLSAYWLPQIALQLTAGLAVAFTAVVCYRLVDRCYDTRFALTASLAVVVGTPIGFWATLPKRHSVTALLVVCAMYTLYRSRETPSITTATRFRALTYAWVGFAAWVHAAEALILLCAIVLVDLPTARSNRPRDLLVVGAVFLVSLLPFFLTNAVISGNPVQPPRLLEPYYGGALDVDGGGTGGSGGGGSELGSSTGGGTGASADSSGGRPGLVTPILGAIVPVIDTVRVAVVSLFEQFKGSFFTLVRNPNQTVEIFFRTGYVDGFRPTQDAAVNLSVVASMPSLGVLAGAAAHMIRVGRAGFGRRRFGWSETVSPVHVVDAFSVAYVLLLFGVFLRQLPLSHMFTVRYLHPLYAIGIYWLVRIPAVRRTITTAGRLFFGVTTTTVVLGVPVYLGALALGEFSLGETVQLYALAALTVALVVAIWAVLATLSGTYDRLGAVVLGVAVGSMAVYLLVSGLSLFPVTGEFLLPISRTVSEQIHYMRLFGSTPPY